MKRIFYLLIICLLFGCDEDKKNDETPVLSVDITSLSFTNEGGSKTLQITSNTDWSIDCPDRWTVSRSGGSGNAELVVSVQENPLTESYTGTLTITAEKCSPVQVTLKQLGSEPVVSLVGDGTLIVESDAGSLKIAIESNGECDVVIKDGDGWLTLQNDISTNEGLLHTYDFSLTENNNDMQRRAVVTFTLQNTELAVSATVLQNGKGSLPEIKFIGISEQGITVGARQWLRINAEVFYADNGTYRWTVDDEEISTEKDLFHVMRTPGTYTFRLTVKNENGENYADIPVIVQEKTYDYNVSKGFEHLPAPGQFVNVMPQWEEGDTQEDMNAKALESIRDGGVSLGGFGGRVVMGFDHVLMNTGDDYDFRIKGNAQATSSEPGIIMVSVDANGNGLPDDEWYEIAGSAFHDPKTVKDCKITYTLTHTTPEMLIKWEDNTGKSGEIVKNEHHNQNYFPEWLADNSYTLEGTMLTNENVYDTSGNGFLWVSLPFDFGYADNCMENQDCSKIKIGWAVDKFGQPVQLKGIDFIRVHTGINAFAGWMGEISTEIFGFEEFNINE